jgi:hypothetical protein
MCDTTLFKNTKEAQTCTSRHCIYDLNLEVPWPSISSITFTHPLFDIKTKQSTTLLLDIIILECYKFVEAKHEQCTCEFVFVSIGESKDNG